MRKAQGLARGRSRRKQQGGDGPAQQQPPQGPGGSVGPAQHHLQHPNGGGPEGGGGGGSGPPHPSMQRRKPTPEEQALTAKNYRLAKELSELRVRHRDETKTVTRLTMENMNLASRCREAITHVAMLKKELLVQQRRVEESERHQQPSLASVSAPMGQPRQQQQQHQAPPPQTPLSDMKQALAASPPPPPPAGQPPSANKRVSPDTELERQSQRQEKRGSDGSGGSGDSGGGAAPFVSGGANRVLAAKAHQQQQQQMPTVDDDFSDEDDVDDFLEDGPDDELDVNKVTDQLSKEAFFGEEPGRPAQHLPATPEKEDIVGTTSPVGQVKSQPPKRKIQKGVDPDIGRPPSPVFSNAAMVKARTEMSTMSSIDAFEASFDTTFPTSFQSAVQKDGPAPSLDISFDVPDFSDPFYLGSDGDGGNVSFPETHGSSGGVPMTSSGGPSVARTNNFAGATSGAKPSRSSPAQTQTRHASASGQVGKTPPPASPANSGFSPDLFPSSPMSELRKEPDFVDDEDVDRLSAPEFPAANAYQTPAMNGHSTSPQAPGPVKSGTGAASARARYDAALGPTQEEEEVRSNGTNVPPKSPGDAASIASKRELSNSASQVLKRIQQRRAKTSGSESPVNAAPPPPESSPAQNGTAPGSQFSPYGAGPGATAGNAADAKLAAIRNSARRAPANDTADGDYDYGPRRRPAKPYSGASSGGGDSNIAMFKATNPSPANSKYRSANSRTASHRLSPTSMHAELDNLDAIAAQAGAAPSPTAAPAPAGPPAGTDGTRRPGRSVKQPVSYAEPSLTAKIRKGHQYFPKQNDAAAVANGQSIMTPAASPAHHHQPR